MDALYARQSLDVKDSISTEMQIEMAKKLVEPGDDYSVYIDKGFSGKNTNRPDFHRMMKDIENGQIRRIIVYKLDRFSRSILDFSIAWEKMAKYKVEFVSVNEKFDTSTPIGKAMIFIIMVFAQLERETIAERVTDNYYARAKLGSWVGGPPPYGYQLGKNLSSGRNTPILVPDENMEIVEEIFKRYVKEEKISLGAIAKDLQERGIQSKNGKIHWNNIVLNRIMRNPVYVKADADVYLYYKALGVEIANDIEEFDGTHSGLLVGKRYSNTRERRVISEAKLSLSMWEGHISSKVWLECQAKLSANTQIQNSHKGKYTWLTGLLKCWKCGRSLRVQPYRSTRTGELTKLPLLCTGRIDHECDQIVKYEVVELEIYVARELRKILNKCEEQPVFEEQMQPTNQAKIELAKIEQQIENLMNCIASGNASADTVIYINKKIEELNKKQDELNKMLIPKKKQIPTHKIDFDMLDFEAKKLVAITYIDKIRVFQNHIEIIYKV